MNVKAWGNRLRIAAVLCIAFLLATPAVPGVKNMAVVVSAGSKLADVPLADLTKLCKGTQKTWPDGRSFTLIIKDPESSEMRGVVQKILGGATPDIKAAIAKVNESRQVIKIVGSDEDLLRTVEATPGAVGIVDVYAINSAVKVLRLDGKLPFDAGYALKGI
jgi:ABC-type phosphate transport system substrate-binding protein